jgi:inner membrane protein
MGVEREVTFRRWKILFWYLVCANLPDLDFLPGYLVGKPNLYHHGISHSLGLAALTGLAVGLYGLLKKKISLLKTFGIVFGLYFSHVLLDCLSIDTSPPFGVQLLWPLSGQYFISPLSIFPTVYRAGTSGAFLRSLLNIGNLKLIAVELVYFIPLVVLAHLLIRRSRRGKGVPSTV